MNNEIQNDSPTQVGSIEAYENELNQLHYQIKYQIRQKDELASELKKIRSSRSYRLAVRMSRGYRLSVSVVRRGYKIISWPLINAGRRLAEWKSIRRMRRLTAFYNRLMEEANALPISNGSSYYKKFDLAVAIITDEYMYNYYKGAFRQTFWITPENWETTFSENRIDLFLYVSCWRGGHQNEWRGHVRLPHLRDKIDDILAYCSHNNIKAVFHTIEDPTNFEHFLPLAQKFKYIFTSDADVVERYREECPGCVCAYVGFGINPEFNNPIGMQDARKYDAFFAGSYPTRYKQRCKDMQVIFDSILKSGLSLTIADRNSGLGLTRYKFPEKYGDSIIEAFQHQLLQSVHKLFVFNINLNSVKGSSTMCAMRVYELQAQGTEIISNYAKSVSNRFPGITLVSYAKDLSILKEKAEDFLSYEKRIRAIRRVMSEKTVFHRVSELLNVIEFKIPESMQPRLLIVSDLEVMQPGLEGLDKVHVFYTARDTFERDALQRYDYVAFFSDEYEYEPYYLLDMLNAFKYVDVPFVTRDAYFKSKGIVKGIEHNYVTTSPNPNRTVYSTQYDLSALLTHIETGERLGTGYSVDALGINFERHIIKMSRAGSSECPILSIIVPVFNNGKLLLERCFESIRMNKRFGEFEIILIDDCSNDGITQEIIQQLSRRHSNVRVYHFSDGPSGTASRPRNKGIELSQAEYITFLDPDNAISPMGYDRLISEAQKDAELDAVFGFQLKITSGRVMSIGRLFDKPNVVVNDPLNEIVLAKRFPVVTTQATVLRCDVLRENEVGFIEGAIGQDTTFGYEVLLVTNKIKFIHEAYLEYYAERPGSVTNTIGKEFFERSLILEENQKAMLQEYGVWEDYKRVRASGFINIWYGKKLNMVEDCDRRACVDIVRRIAQMNDVETGVDLEGGFDK